MAWIIGWGIVVLGTGRILVAGDGRRVFMDWGNVVGKRDLMFKFCVGSERAGVMLRDENQRQLEVVRRELGFEYLRCHGIFHDDMKAYREVEGRPVYDWSRIDAFYDSLLKIRMKPFVEIGFMPRDLASGKKTVFWWNGNVTPPKDFGKWGDFIEAFARHLTERYGKEEVKRWYFEVWNEPNLKGFWWSDQATYFHLYDVTAAAIKKVEGTYRVGGPATAGIGWVPEMIEHCVENQVPLDFVSTHTYGVEGFFDADGKAVTQLSADYNSIFNDVRKVRGEIEASVKRGLPVHFTEWNSSYSSRDAVHDTYPNASFILDKIKKCAGELQSMSYWTYSDLFEEAGPPPAPFHGGFGLLNREGIRKASFFAYKYLNELGDEELKNGDAQSWACRDGKSLTVLLWDHTLPKQDSPNQVYFLEKRPAKELGAVEVKCSGMPAGKYVCEIYRTGYEANDAYSAYMDMGRPKELSGEQLKVLQGCAVDRAEVSEAVEVLAGEDFVKFVSMRENDLVLVVVRPR